MRGSLSRLKQATRGNWNGSAIDNTRQDEQWLDGSGNPGLTQTGNWKRYRLNLNGDADFTDAGELDETRTHNQANELTGRDTDSNGTDNYTLSYDLVGNLTDDGKSYKYEYDWAGRLRKVRNRANDALVSEYTYNGLGFKVGWHYDVDADGTVESNGDDPWYYSCFDERWRVIATFRGSDSSPKERFVYHNAGVGGMGGVSYIDAVYRRDRDSNTAWTAASDGVLEDHKYLCANQHQDVGAVVTDTGKMVEWVKYSAYGVPYGLPAGDTDSDGDWDATDAAVINGWTTGYDVRADADLSGAVAAADATHANSITTGYQTLGRTVPTSTAVANRNAYASYEFEPVLAGSKYHCEHRVYDAELGRWLKRDPLGYVGGMSLYAYVGEQPVQAVDPTGLVTSDCDGCASRGGTDPKRINTCECHLCDCLFDANTRFQERLGDCFDTAGGLALLCVIPCCIAFPPGCLACIIGCSAVGLGIDSACAESAWTKYEHDSAICQREFVKCKAARGSR